MIKEFAYRYSRWDGSQEVDLRWKKLTDDFLEKFLASGDPASAYEWMLRQGFDFGPDFDPIRGIDRMVEDLMKIRRDIMERFNLSGLGDEIMKRLDEIVGIEKNEISKRFDEASKRYPLDNSDIHKRRMEELFKREASLVNMPRKPKDAVEALKKYDWLSNDAAAKFRELLDAIRRIQEFASQNWFSGKKPMSLDETREAIGRIGKIDDLIRALDQGMFSALGLDDLAKFLGPDAKKSIETMLQFLEYLRQSGMVELTDEGWQPTAKAIRRIGRKALKDIYSAIGKDAFGSHETEKSGIGWPTPDVTRPHRYGDPFDPDLKATLMKSVMRRAVEGKKGTPIAIEPDDFMVAEMEYKTSTATALLLDMSLSMFREGRFVAAKKVALALDNLIRSEFPRDRFHVIGFSTVARELRGKELATATGGIGGDIFTNIQDALRLGSKLISGGGAKNRQIILITDGQPTAYTLDGMLHVEWPMLGVSPNSNRETLKEVKRVTSRGIVINTFMLDSSPALVGFVNKVTKINRGRAFYTTPEKLGNYLLVDYINRWRRVVN